MTYRTESPHRAVPWNKGRLLGQKPPLKIREIWAIRIRLQLANKVRELALFNLTLDSKLRSCDFVRLRVRDIAHGTQVSKYAMIMQQKTQQPVQFKITQQTREALTAWIEQAELSGDDYLFPSRMNKSPHISTQQYARIVRSWISDIGLDPADYGTHSYDVVKQH